MRTLKTFFAVAVSALSKIVSSVSFTKKATICNAALKSQLTSKTITTKPFIVQNNKAFLCHLLSYLMNRVLKLFLS